MFEQTYKSMNDQITANSALITSTLVSLQNTQKHKLYKTGPVCRRPIAIAAILVLFIVLATPVLAANIPVIYELMYLMSPETAQFFMPVQESCEDNGIRMEVVSTYIHDDTAEIYITMQDLIGDRVDEKTDLFDSYSIHRAVGSSGTCQLVGYDAQTKTATFLITVSEWGNHDITGSKLTFSVREFISHKIALEDVPAEINLAEVSEAAATQTISPVGAASYNALAPGTSVYSPIKGLDVTAIGYIDGKLHIQLATVEKLTFDGYGYFYLIDKDGNLIHPDFSVIFVKDADNENRIDYEEFVFDIPKWQIESYKLYGSFYKSELNTKGNWRVTIPLNQKK